MSNLIGRQLGNYQLLRLLGQGGYANVFLGKHIHLKTQAAIKVLHGRATSQDVEGFLNEAQTIATLKHPHIVRVLDFGFDDMIPFLVMDYMPNGSVRERYPHGTVLPMAALFLYTKQTAAALQYAHENKIIHRDIKPGNILLENEHKVVLSDFGIVAVAHSTSSLETQNIVGTVSYMAPEQLQGKPRPATDQYALGITLYQWLCGALPFTGTSFAEIAMHQLLDAPPPLREKIPAISPAIEQVVMKALAKDPQQRFPSIQAFADELEQVMGPSLHEDQILATHPIET